MAIVQIKNVNGINTCVCQWGEGFTLEQVRANHPNLDIREGIEIGAIEVDGVFTSSDPEVEYVSSYSERLNSNPIDGE